MPSAIATIQAALLTVEVPEVSRADNVAKESPYIPTVDTLRIYHYSALALLFILFSSAAAEFIAVALSFSTATDPFM
jgi:hypothetical protein